MLFDKKFVISPSEVYSNQIIVILKLILLIGLRGQIGCKREKKIEFVSGELCFHYFMLFRLGKNKLFRQLRYLVSAATVENQYNVLISTFILYI